MVIKMYKYLFLSFSFVIVNTTIAANIVVERYENWEHPVLKVFKKYSTVLYKVQYSKDGKYPIFCVRLRGDPQIGSRSSSLGKLYYETLRANSNDSYSFIDRHFGEGHGIRVDVEWKNKEKTRFEDHIIMPAPLSICNLND